MKEDNVISLEHYRNEKEKRENPSAHAQEQLAALDYPDEDIETVKVLADILTDEGMSNEDIADAIRDQYGDMLATPYAESGNSLEDLDEYRDEKQKRELGASAIEDTIYVIYGGGESQTVPVHSGRRNHLKVVDNSSN